MDIVSETDTSRFCMSKIHFNGGKIQTLESSVKREFEVEQNECEEKKFSEERE